LSGKKNGIFAVTYHRRKTVYLVKVSEDGIHIEFASSMVIDPCLLVCNAVLSCRYFPDEHTAPILRDKNSAYSSETIKSA
jgi:hypothetical protein